MPTEAPTSDTVTQTADIDTEPSGVNLSDGAAGIALDATVEAERAAVLFARYRSVKRCR